jgi:hypothetical protein
VSEVAVLFVIGAGASHEVGLPLGSGLKTAIAEYLDIRYERGFELSSGDERLIEAFQFHARLHNNGNRSISAYQRECWKLRDAMPQAQSIDSYLDVHTDNPVMLYCGKAAIVRAILAAEGSSKLKPQDQGYDKRVIFKSIENTWYTRLWQKLVENCPVDALQTRIGRVAFIVFNYDRCLEHFLHSAIRNYYQLSEHDAAAVLTNAQIFHPYGQVGRLPWESGSTSIEFGADVHPDTLNQMTGQIKTFSEGTDPTESEIVQIRSVVAGARRIVFLGFAYHVQNLALLFPPSEAHSLPHTTEVYGTALGISASDSKVIARDLAKGLRIKTNAIHLENTHSCNDLFGEYGRSLSLKQGSG